MKLEQEETPATISAALMEFADLPSFRPSRREDPRLRAYVLWMEKLEGDWMRMEEQTVKVHALPSWSAKWWKAVLKLDRLNALLLYNVRKLEADYGVKIAG